MHCSLKGPDAVVSRVNSCKADNWSIHRSLAFLAAVFAIVLGSLMPYAAMAAVQPGQSIVICSSEGLQTIRVGETDAPPHKALGAKCAACILPLVASLPMPPAPVPALAIKLATTDAYAPLRASPPPPSRAPPRPHSTAPPLA